MGSQKTITYLEIHVFIAKENPYDKPKVVVVMDKKEEINDVEDEHYDQVLNI